uniref:Activin_recp domain-containing protein n=1 Tax=Parastrongyloides trichosuri TaxID=131310 RepID=A0A0N4ZQT1_PARTI
MIILIESRFKSYVIIILFIKLIQVHLNSDNIDFQEIFKQRLKGNKVDTCPCIILPNHSKCINYDPRYLAVTLEEAVLSFPDITYNIDAKPLPSEEITKFQCKTEECLQCVGIMNQVLHYQHIINKNNPLKFNFHVPNGNELNPAKCKKYRMTADVPIILPVKSLVEKMKPLVNKGKQFLSIPDKQKLLKRKFTIVHEKSSFLSPKNVTLTNKPSTHHIIRDSHVRINHLQTSVGVEIVKTSNSINTLPTSSFVGSIQSKLTIIHKTSTTNIITTTQIPTTTESLGYNVNPPTHIETLDEVVKKKTERSVPPLTLHYSMEPMFPSIINNNNHRRLYGSPILQQSTLTKGSIPQPVLGIRHKISCTPRGQPTTGTSTFLNLCSFCWSWRKLPDGYFPKIINELVCDTDSHCLSGWGQCEQLHRTVDVFHQDNNGEWKQISLQIASCCVCKVQAGSDIHGLVIG